MFSALASLVALAIGHSVAAIRSRPFGRIVVGSYDPFISVRRNWKNSNEVYDPSFERLQIGVHHVSRCFTLER